MSSIRIPPALRAEGGGEARVDADGETVRELLDDLMARFPNLRERIFAGGEIASFVN
nr:molybdopterin synthase sulfur carrier subunit [Actinomycetota bacterium]